MKFDLYTQRDNVKNNIFCKKNIFITSTPAFDCNENITEFLRFEEKKDHFRWVHEDEICFVKTADHYIKALIHCGDSFTWMSRHSTLKELLDMLSGASFLRLNKFYLLNLNHYSHINLEEKTIFLKNDFSISVPHRISPYLFHLLKTSNT